MILVTGGAGYLGSHTAIALENAGLNYLIFDNFSNSSTSVASRVKAITGRKLKVVTGDVRNKESILRVFNEYPIESVIHFAGLKSVAESVRNPLAYYENNVVGTLNLLDAMEYNGVSRLVFSSSATVYGEPQALPIKESDPIGNVANPYGRSKYYVEQILADIAEAKLSWDIACLRYFNPVGAHISGLIGEAPMGIPNNLFPYICEVAAGKRQYLEVFGQDYETLDGTGVRDYLHVEDLAEAHVLAVQYLKKSSSSLTVNLGTGRGYSVLEVLAAFERATGKKIQHVVRGRRAGDVGACYADTDKASQLLGWVAKRDLDRMCEDAWRWESTRHHHMHD